ARQEWDVLNQPSADPWMCAHDLPLLRAERPRLEEDRVRDADLADIVKDDAVHDISQIRLEYAVGPGDGLRMDPLPARMVPGGDEPFPSEAPEVEGRATSMAGGAAPFGAATAL